MQKFQILAARWMFVLTLLVMIGCKNEPKPGDLISINQIDDTWIRIESNNPGSDGMKVEVSGNSATLIEKAGSGFSVGDVKWKDITAMTENTFAYQELGSDYNYYEATITLINDNEISISVGSTGAGNSQKWVRDDGSIVIETPAELGCNDFSSDQTLKNTSRAVDYVVSCVLDVTANLVIEPGVVIEFEENAGIGVYDGGTINAVGTEDEPIVLRGQSPVAGYWRGIHVETNSINNQLDHVTIQHAGSNYVYCCNEKASLFLKGAKMTIKNTQIAQGGGYGIHLKGNVSLDGFENNMITTHKEEPIFTTAFLAGSLNGAGLDFSGNTKDFIRIYDADVSEPVTIPALNVPYLQEGFVLDVTESMTISAGVEWICEANAGIGIYDNGSLKLDGSSANEIVIRGKEAVDGYWRGIHIETNSLNNVFSYARISEAGANYVYCCNEIATVFLKDGKLSMDHTVLSNGASYGLVAKEAAELRNYASNTVTSHKNLPLYLAAERVGELDGEESDYTGNEEDFIGIFNSDVSNNTTWPTNNVPYLVDGSVIDIKKPLIIEPGVEVVFRSSGGLGVYDDASFYAVGTANDPIIFRGFSAQAGYWRGIHIETNSLDNQIKHATISHSGNNYVYCCNDKAGVLLKGGQLVVENATFSDNAGCGITVKSGGNLTENDNTFSSNSEGDICN